MAASRSPAKDPRTVARDIPGIFDALFPQLVPGVVAHFNRGTYSADNCGAVSAELINASALQPAMLFEVAVAAGEQLIEGRELIDWTMCLEVAVHRQRRHFDAKLPQNLSEIDKEAATHVAINLATMLSQLSTTSKRELIRSPAIPGYQWIASGVGDFAVGTQLIEVKCTHKHFSSSDYRQIMMYWLLSYASSIEGGVEEWSEGILLNPRLNRIVTVRFDDILRVIGAGRSKVDVVELFSSMVGDNAFRMIASI